MSKPTYLELEQELQAIKAVETELRETAQRYNTLVENLNGMVYRCHHDTGRTMEYVSAGALILTGSPPEDLIAPHAIHYGNLIHPDDQQRVWDAVQAAIEQQQPFTLIYRLRTRTGEEKWVREQGRAVFPAPGSPAVLEGFIIDITEQQQARLTQQESEAFYRNMFEDHPAILLLISPDDGAMVDANRAACAFYGYSRAELTRMNIAQINTLPANEIQSAARRALAVNQNHFFFKHRRADGSIRDVEVFSGPVQRHGKTILFSIVQDITERTQTEAALRRSEERFRNTLNNMLEGCQIIGFDWRYLYLNDAADKHNRRPKEELLGQNYMEMWPGIETTAVFGVLKRCMEERVAQQVENEFVFPDGTRGWFELSIQPVPEGIFILSIDRTQRNQLAVENKQLTDQFYQAQKMEAVGQLAGGIAHDFNNLLVPILGFAEMGQMELTADNPLHANFTRIKEAADRAANLTRQILAFSRKQMLEMKLIDLNHVIADFQKMLGRLLRESITLKIHLNPQLRLIYADQGQLEQVLMNLVVNARDAMPGGGTLTIETNMVVLDEHYTSLHLDTEPGLYVLLAVSDTGHGMDAQTQQRIFEPFFTTKERGHGTGLGLATVFGIIKQHQGNIWVYSEPGRGTTFKIYLPVAADQAMPVSVKKSASADQLTGSETILVVEDETGVRQLVTHSLQTHGYTVLEAASPAEALELAANYANPIHLLLTDVVMPGMNGRQLYSELEQQRPDLKVLFMSGYTNNVIVHHGALDPTVSFLAKPFSVHTLLLKVRDVLD